MLSKRLGARSLATLVALSLVAASCGGDGDGDSAPAPAPTTAAATTAAPAAAETTTTTAAPCDPSDEDPYVIGGSIDFSGPFSFAGIPQASGFETYINSVNDEGGVNCRLVKYLALDEAGDVARGISNYREMIDEGALAVFNIAASVVWAGLIPLAAEEEVAQIAGAGIDKPLLDDPGAPYLFRYTLLQTHAAPIQLQMGAEVGGLADSKDVKVALMAYDSPATQAWGAAMRADAARRGWTIVNEQFVPIATTDFSQPAAAIAAAEPDLVMVALIQTLAPLGVRALRDRGVAVPIANAAITAANSENDLKQLEDPLFVVPRDYEFPLQADPIPALVELQERAKKYGFEDAMTSTQFTMGYVQAMVAVEALKACGDPCDPKAYAKALETVSVDTQGLTGDVSFGPEKHWLLSEAIGYAWSPEKGHGVPVTDWLDWREVTGS